MKTCPCCDRQLPATEHFFDADADYPDGLSLNCWRCNREQIKDVPDVPVAECHVAIDMPKRAIVSNERIDTIAQRESRRIDSKLNSIRSAARAALNR